MGQILAITSGTGCVGKTVFTANVGTVLAQLGKKVALIDGSFGLRSLDTAMGLEHRLRFDSNDVMERRATLKQALIKDHRVHHLYLLAAGQTGEPKDVPQHQLQELTKELAGHFDFVFIDSPSGIEYGFKLAIANADKAIVLCSPDLTSLRDADRVIGLWEATKSGPALLVVNRIRPRTQARGHQVDVDSILEYLSVDLLGIVPEDDQVLISGNRGDPVVHSQKSRAGRAFRNIAWRLTGEQVPLENLDEGQGLLGKLGHFLKPLGGRRHRVVAEASSCWSCGEPAGPDHAFCPKCGADIAGVECPRCCKRMPCSFQFCGTCGAGLSGT